MEVLTLLRQAREAGLTVASEGAALVIRGPKTAEPVVRLLAERKAEVLAALDAVSWHDRYAARIVHWFLHGRRPWQEAERLAFGELILTWHRRHGARPDPGRCAGCGDDLPKAVGLIVDRDGARVHFDGARRVDCITAYGARWRGTAVTGLRALELDPPEGFELL